MKKFVDLNLVVHPANYNIPNVIERYSASIYYVNFLRHLFDVEMIIHGKEGQEIIDGVKYASLKGSNSFWTIPNDTAKYLKEINPDFLLVQGLVFPVQVIRLKSFLPRTKILVQHHGGVPFQNPLKKYLQKWADKYTDAYLFTALNNADEWIKSGVIKNADKCKEVLEASTHITLKDKSESLKRTGVQGNNIFLWVGRLDKNKDPLTVLKAFAKYLANGLDGKLYMIYQTVDILPEVKKMIDKHPQLKDNVHLVGAVPHQDLSYWYSVADYYVSASHYEGSGYALIESMACGCTPVVTSIPSFRYITDNGTYGYLYDPGNVDALYKILIQLTVSVSERSKIIQHFNQKLSFKAIADSIYNICNTL